MPASRCPGSDIEAAIVKPPGSKLLGAAPVFRIAMPVAMLALSAIGTARADESAALNKLRGLGASVRTIEVGQAPYVEIVIAADSWQGHEDDLGLLTQIAKPVTLDLSRASISPAAVSRLKAASGLTKL